MVEMASLSCVYVYNISSRVTTLATATAQLTTEEIRERHLKHIAEISKHLDTEPIQSEYPTFEQQEWMRRKIRSGFTKPVRDQLTEREKASGRSKK